MFDSKGLSEYAELIDSISVAEMIHLKLLGKTICALGAQPIYTACPPAAFNFYSAKFVSYSRSLKNMIEDDIMGEKYAIYGYEKMLCRLKDGTLKALIVRIIEDEKLHLAELKRILEELSC